MNKTHRVELRFFQDDATGEFGLAHKDTLEGKVDTCGFNAFWDGRGIFHDVFEHWFEFQHKNFMGEYAMNIGGEMAAMGAFAYYTMELGISNRMFPGGFRSASEISRTSTESMIQEAIEDGRTDFGNKLLCSLPFQKAVPNYSFESELNEYEYNLKKMRAGKGAYDEDEKQHCRDYKKSCTIAKIRRLHRWGYRIAQDLIPNERENAQKLIDFIDFWNEFCKKNKAEELSNHLRGITFEVTKDENDIISWKAIAIPKDKYQTREAEITKWFDVYEVYIQEEEELAI